MSRPSKMRLLTLIVIWTSGIILALGSRSYEPDEEVAVDPVDVDVLVVSVGNLQIDNGNTEDTLTSIQVSGSFSKAGNAGITLREVPVTLDTSTSLNATIVPSQADNLLTGTLIVDVSQALEFGLNRLPEQGQLEMLFNSTTILLTFDGDSDNVLVQAGAETRPAMTFPELRSRFSDTDANIFERAASKGYRLLENIWQYARLGESLQDIIEEQADMLESMGIDQPLTLSCNNSSGTPTPVFSLNWASDASGTGDGSPGNGDRFTTNWTNCNLSEEDRFLSLNLELDEYRLNNDTEPRDMSFIADYNMIISDSEIESTLVFAIDRDRVTGTLNISATEQASTTTQ